MYACIKIHLTVTMHTDTLMTVLTPAGLGITYKEKVLLKV